MWFNEVLEAKDREVARLKRLASTPKTAAGPSRKRRAPAGDGTAAGDEAEGEEDEVVDAFALEPAKRGTGGRKPSANPKGGIVAAAREAAKLRGRRKRAVVFGHMAQASAELGGRRSLGAFFISMIRHSTFCTGLVRRHRYLPAGFLGALVDDAEIRAKLARDIDQRRRPKLSAFQAARFSGVTFGSIDKLRFAMNRAPGHSTMIKADREWEETLGKSFCASGPHADAWWSTRTEAEQQAEAENARSSGLDAEDEDEDEGDAGDDSEAGRAAEAALRAPADAIDGRVERAACYGRGAVALLRVEFPDDSDAKQLDRWEGGLDLEGVFQGANVVQICAVGGDEEVLGIIKALVTEAEVFIDELLVGENARKRGLAMHLFVALLELVPSASRMRLQVKKRNKDAIQLYEWLSFEDWETPTDPSDPFYDQRPEHRGRTKFMATNFPAKVKEQASSVADRKPLVGIRMWKQAAYPINDGALDHVGSDTGHEGVPETSARPRDGRERRAGAVQRARSAGPAGATDDFDDPNFDQNCGLDDLDDEQRMAAPPAAAKQPAKWFGCAIKDAVSMIMMGTDATRIASPNITLMTE